MKLKLFLSSLIILFFVVGYSQEYSEFTDPRDGKKYKAVTIDIILEGGVTVKRTWMAENLNYENEDSYCYKNESAYCEAYGRLYTFQSAYESCPEGWHLPTIGEWNLLFNTYGGIRKAGLALQKDGESGINLTLGGFGDPGNVFKNIGMSGNYWDAENKSSKTAGLVTVAKDSKEIYHSAIGNWHRNSCRCVKDFK